MRNRSLAVGACGMLLLAGDLLGQPKLRVGIAGHAFDHLGGLGEQAETAVASGANIIYVTGVGGLGYQGAANLRAAGGSKESSQNIPCARPKGRYPAGHGLSVCDVPGRI